MLSALNEGGVRSKTLLARLAEQPKSPAIIGVAEVLCEQGRYSEAITRLRSVADLYSDVYRYNLVLARACRNAGEAKSAKAYYEKACQIAPQNEVAIRELIALTAFPHAVPKPSPHLTEPTMERGTSVPTQSEPKAPEPEAQSTFKLDKEKLATVLSSVIGSIGKSTEPPIEPQKPASSLPSVSSPVIEAFRKTDALLEQAPDIDALESDLSDEPPTENASPTPSEHSPKVDVPPPQSSESDIDTDAIARQITEMSRTDEPSQLDSTASSTVASEVTPTSSMQASSTPSAPTPIPFDEHGKPIVGIDRNKLAQALSGIYEAKGTAPSVTQANEGENDMPFQMPTKADTAHTPTPLASTPQSESQSSRPLSFEEELMAIQMQGGDIDAFIHNKETSHHDESVSASTPSSTEVDIDRLAREIMNAQLPKVIETNDPTPVAEQRQPFPDDEEIKTPTRQLAKIFQSQGAYAKAIKVYEMLAEREPENASLYEILISNLRDKMSSQM
ncbi:MAG: tetratricopeptide repeat protein [Chloroherpetonaceae bacterium]